MGHRADVGVVGAGPAGTRVAQLLSAAGVTTVLLDPKAPWEKPCGGALTASTFDHVPDLTGVQSLARRVQKARVELTPHAGFDVPLERPLWILSRETLGRWQLERARQAGAVHVPSRVSAIHRERGAWRLETSEGEVRVPFLVGADGAASLVRRVAAPDFSVELAPTRVAYPPGPGPTADTMILRFYCHPAGYLWDFPRPDHRSVGILMTDGTWRRPRLDGEVDSHRMSSDGCARVAPPRAGAVIGTAQLGHGDYGRIAGKDFALLGDAAGLADPLTGEGIQNALRAADLLAEALLRGRIQDYPVRAREAFEREFRLARTLRRRALEGGLGLRLIERGMKSRASNALVVAMLNGLTEHDTRMLGFLSRWTRSYRAMPFRPAPTDRPHTACPCGCQAFSGEGRTAAA
jgi:flavin-dependent dehydrogenase